MLRYSGPLSNCYIYLHFFILGECRVCSAGKYCEDPGLSSVQGDCDPGYLCINGANSSKPTDGITGSLCPMGQYCDGGLSVGKEN